MGKSDQVVIFIFIKGNKILIEKRKIKKYKTEQYLIPGGRVKKSLENLEQALEREIKEELGIIPLEFIPLPLTEEIIGIHGQLLTPFIVTRWEGNFPPAVLDRNHPLTWLPITEVLKSPILPTRKIVKALEIFLQKNATNQP